MKPEFIIIHHSATDRDQTSFESVNEFHKQKWNFKSKLGYYIGYQYFITADGKLYQGRADDETGAHTIGYNINSIGICLAGNFMVEQPTPAQINSLESLVASKREQWNIPVKNILGHREVGQTLCPGDNLMSWVKEYREKFLQVEKPKTKEEIKVEIIKLLEQL